MKQERSVKYVGRVYMISTKSIFSSNTMHNYDNTIANYDYCITKNRAIELTIAAYKKIIAGEIYFNSIKDFDKSYVNLMTSSADSDDIYVNYNDGKINKVICKYEITEIRSYYDLVLVTSANSLECNEEDHRIQKFGLFWYVLGDTSQDPMIKKRFLWFTKLDKILNWIYNKLERTALDY